ncbi:glycosyltransferase family 2 protein [Gelidibacter gilvus]|uniref:Glycosyltransferase family 2 protein n=1 Tax=Gelidibacter gilvus TaxID=59602 RepID=A0A4Q0XFE3_9FLAO|nr:glycosyltransferase family 2 protein [Gelidibacter gilvus]RXJ45399.1 glycosyltransferase family 2 protein [Gelidibacter gilvus]
MPKQSLVSIIIPTFNRAHLIGETLDSVLAQTYTNWECIVVDDGSTDGTSQLMEAYCAKDPRFQYHHRPKERPKGANVCRNYGFEQSIGEFINWLDSDDLFSNNKLEAQVSELLMPEIDITTCTWGFLENDSRHKLREFEIYKNYSSGLKFLDDLGKYSTYLPVHAYLIKRELINQAGFWNEDLIVNQDGEYLTRVLIGCQKIKYVNNGFVLYRRSDPGFANISSSTINNIQGLIESWILIEKHLKPYYNADILYVSSAKSRIYSLVKSKYPSLILPNIIFFRRNVLLNLKQKVLNFK